MLGIKIKYEHCVKHKTYHIELSSDLKQQGYFLDATTACLADLEN
jgi:hypothetical protein